MSANEQLFDRVLSHFGGSTTKFSQAIRESVPAVCNWRTRGIPLRHVQTVARLTGISVRELRPDDWHMYWPERATKRKPAKVAA